MIDQTAIEAARRMVALFEGAGGDPPREEDALVVAYALLSLAAPGHTDLMVTPESLDRYLEANPLPAPGQSAIDAAMALAEEHYRPRPMCRDCADHDGTCPTTKLPCDPKIWLAQKVAAFAAAQVAARDELLDWLDRRGGLGLDAHERIRKIIGEPIHARSKP